MPVPGRSRSGILEAKQTRKAQPITRSGIGFSRECYVANLGRTRLVYASLKRVPAVQRSPTLTHSGCPVHFNNKPP